MQRRISEKDIELNKRYKQATINKEDNLLWIVFKKMAVPMQKIKIIQRVKGRACVIQSLCAFSSFVDQHKVWHLSASLAFRRMYSFPWSLGQKEKIFFALTDVEEKRADACFQKQCCVMSLNSSVHITSQNGNNNKKRKKSRSLKWTILFAFLRVEIHSVKGIKKF